MYSLCFHRSPRSTERRSQGRSLCLVVDDDAVCRTVVQAQLRTLGLDAIAAACAREAMVQIRRRRPSTVLIDSCLPDSDGYGLAQRIRRHEIQSRRGGPPAPLVLVALSARHDDLHVRRCIASGMDDVLAKPASLPALATALGLPLLPQAAVGGQGADRLQELYRASCLRDLAALRLALRDEDWARARKYAHRIRGASQVVGAHALAGIAAMLERVDGDREAESGARRRALQWMQQLLDPAQVQRA